MLSIKNLQELAVARLDDARVLCAAQRLEGAYYLSGYSVELALKAQICRTLRWPGFPETNKEFERFSSFKVHNLEVLLKLSGREESVKRRYLAEWTTVKRWLPEWRYLPVGATSRGDVEDMLYAASTLLRKL
ncbi:MAG: hypothetical protein ABW202_00205 [Duganella sp.]